MSFPSERWASAFTTRHAAALSIAVVLSTAAVWVLSSAAGFAQDFERGYDNPYARDPLDRKMQRSFDGGGASGFRGSRDPCLGGSGGAGLRAPDAWDRPCR